MKNIALIISFLISIGLAKAQHGFISSNQSVSIDSNKVVLIQGVTFNFGSGSDCPPLSRYNSRFQSDSIILELFYDTRGGWVSNSCYTEDTIYFTPPSGNYCFYIKTNLIEPNLFIPNDSVIVEADRDTVCNVSVSLKENLSSMSSSLSIYPNPITSGQFLIKSENLAQISGIEILNDKGQVVREFAAYQAEKTIDSSNLPSGFYFVRIWLDDSVILKKIIIVDS